MLPGLAGHLLSESFLEEHLLAHPSPITLADRRDLLAWRQRCAPLGPASPVRAMVEIGAAPFVRALGFDGLARLDVSARPVQDAAAATITGVSPPVALIVAGWGERLDPLWRLALLESRKRGSSWCVLFNGTHVRLLGTSRFHARRYVEFDIDMTLDDGQTLAALWSVLSARALQAAGANTDQSPLHALLDASDRHAVGVSRALKDGVLTASASVLGALVKRGASGAIDVAFEQALTIVYRVLFLLFAEARGLAPLWHPVYRESYSVAALRAAAEQAHSSAGLWDALRAISHMAHAGCRAGNLHVTAFNGRLFAPSRTPLAERRDLDDEAARSAILALSTRPAPDRSGRERIAYRDLGVEQLGAVYETLLDYEPRIEGSAGVPQSGRRSAGGRKVSMQRGSDLRKTTGTFYTPYTITEYLTWRTLAPLVAERAPEEILSLKVLDPAMGSGAFLVSACRHLSQAYEAALVRTGACHSSDLGPPERETVRRSIAERCLYGVDLNPMAVQLARLSLWLTTLAADKPLSFLDHHLQVGNSLLGAWLFCLRHAPTVRRRPRDEDSLPLFEEAHIGAALRDALPVRFSLAGVPDDTVERVRQKEKALATLNRRDTTLSKWKRIADLWCARWFSATPTPLASAFRALSDIILTGRSALPEALATRCLDDAERIAAARRFFHWELEFPEVFFGANGEPLNTAGFDAVIGNPPWDMIRADTGTAESRARSRTDVSGTLRFTRDSRVYASQSTGHANCYQLFVERAVALTRTGGRIGLVLPSGLAIDRGSASLRRLLFSDCAVDALVGFENRQRVFPIHRGVRFLLVTATRGLPTTDIGCRLGESDPNILETAGDDPARDSWFTVRLTPSVLRHLSGDDLTVPDLRAPIDLAIAERAAALFLPLGHPGGWAVRFGRELNATEDRDQMTPISDGGLPVIEGKSIEPFRVKLAEAHCGISAANAHRMLGTRHDRPRLAYRDVANASNRLTLIAAILPRRCVSTHTLFCLRTPLASQAQHFLCGLFNSLLVNYLVRQRVAMHVTAAIVEQLPIPRREHAPGAFEEIAACARLLGRRTTVSSHVAANLRARLNARVAHLYQLTTEEFEHVLSTFPLVPREERDAALQEFLR